MEENWTFLQVDTVSDKNRLCSLTRKPDIADI